MITIKYTDGTTQGVNPSFEHFADWKTADEMKRKVADLVNAIAHGRPYDYYVHDYRVVSRKERARKNRNNN